MVSEWYLTSGTCRQYTRKECKFKNFNPLQASASPTDFAAPSDDAQHLLLIQRHLYDATDASEHDSHLGAGSTAP